MNLEKLFKKMHSDGNFNIKIDDNNIYINYFNIKKLNDTNYHLNIKIQFLSSVKIRVIGYEVLTYDYMIVNTGNFFDYINISQLEKFLKEKMHNCF
jgi:hypothetical protein